MNSPRQIIIALIGALSVFGILGLVLRWSLLVSALLAIISYFAFYLLSRPRVKIGKIVLDNLPAGSALKALLDDAYEDMEAIHQASKKISNLTIRSASEQLYKTGTNILEYLQDNPDKIRLARRFFTYYLDTARGILEKYLVIQDTQLRTDEVRQITRSTEEAMPYLKEAFDKQFINLMANDLMDIEEEIKLLKTNLKMDS